MSMTKRSTRIASLSAIGALLAFPALAQTVKVTPLGGIEGEFCPQDRALVFEESAAKVGEARNPRAANADATATSAMTAQ